MIFHIPHSSPIVPDNMIVKDREILVCTDWHTETIFPDIDVKMVFPFSRFYCDVERFIGDPLESIGQGIAYTHYRNGEQFRSITDSEMNEIYAIYNDWHRALWIEAERQATMLDNVVLVDCHSFNSEQVGIDEENLPDICIGTNVENSPPENIIQMVENSFRNDGYSVARNIPYGGAIVASARSNVYSIMVEINKRTYLDGYSTMSDNFANLKNTIANAMKVLSQFEIGEVIAS